MEAEHALFFLGLVLLIMLVNPANCGLIIAFNSSSGLVSDGVGEAQQPDFVVFERWPSWNGSYSQTAGFMPCTTTVPGNIFLFLVYVSWTLFSAKLLCNGSEILVEVVSPRITGVVFLPLLGPLLDATISIASTLCGNTEGDRNDQVSTGAGLLTGSSTVMLLMFLEGSCISKCDNENSTDEASEDNARRFRFQGSALNIDVRSRYTAKVMIISILPFITIQLSQVLNGTSPIRLAILIALIIFVSLMLSYCLYQVFYPSTLKRRLAFANPKHITPRTVKNLECWSWKRFLKANSEPDIEVIRDQLLSADQFNAVVARIQTEDRGSITDDAVGEVMRDFDPCRDSEIVMDAFTKGISGWLTMSKHPAIPSPGKDLTERTFVDDDFNLVLKATSKGRGELLGVEKIENAKWNGCKAVLMLLLGSIIAASLAEPLANCAGSFSTATQIPPFLVSFVVLPFSSSSDLLSALMFASQNKFRVASFTFSKIHGALSTNNLLCLSAFSVLFYIRQLTWTFTSELLIFLIVWSFLPKHTVEIKTRSEAMLSKPMLRKDLIRNLIRKKKKNN